MNEFSFISARDAHARANQSEVAAQKWLKLIEPLIIKAADANEFSIMHHLDTIDVSFGARLPDLEPKIKGAVSMLREMGYNVTYAVYGDRFVPRGLQDDDGNGPMYQSIGLKISW